MVLRVWHLLVFGVVVVTTALAVGLMAMARQPSVVSRPAASRSSEHVSLTAYLARVKVQQDRFRRTEAKAQAALDTLGPIPDQNWGTAAATFREVRDDFTDIAIQLRLIRPPTEVATEHQGLTKSVELFAASDDGLRQALADSDQQGVIDASANIKDEQIVELRTAWRNAVTAYARTANVSVPNWVAEVGTRG